MADFIDENSDPKLGYLIEGISYIPKLIELLDRNRLSPTFGCFDRSFWHYRTSDFPSGMYQEAVLPLALAYRIDHPRNPYFQEQALKEFVRAGIDYARLSSHPDGSCDDYFPYERAAGAAAFSLYACTEAVLVLGEACDAGHLEFFKKRATYLAVEGHRESGVLSNHKALIALAIYNVYLLTRESFFRAEAEKKIADLLALQSKEGWFPEYQGCDPGYLTFTIDFLCKYYIKSKDEQVLEPVLNAIQFAVHFIHPDGSYGGEYGSRNTFHFMPHGFELMGTRLPLSVLAADMFLKSIKSKKRSYLEDDRIFIHYTYNYLQAYLDYCPHSERQAEVCLPPCEEDFPEAGLYVKNTGTDYFVMSYKKGGVLKVFKNAKLILSDTGFAARLNSGEKAITSVMGEYRVKKEAGIITVEGFFQQHKDIVFTPALFLIFRIFLLGFARFMPANFVRSMIQKKAITKKKENIPVRFTKSIHLGDLSKIKYEIFLDDESIDFDDLWLGSDSTYTYIATSQPFQQGALTPWIHLKDKLPELNKRRNLSFEVGLV